jgi:hypothetical protein
MVKVFITGGLRVLLLRPNGKASGCAGGFYLSDPDLRIADLG